MKIDGKKKWLLLWLCIVIVSMVGCGKENGKLPEEGEKPKIVIGTDNYPPYDYVGTDGKTTGIDAELAKEALKRIGYQPEFVMIDWEDKKELLKSGKIDCIWCCFSINGREEDYQWAGPYMTSRHVVAVRQESNIRTLEDLEGKDVAVQATTKPEEIFLGNTDIKVPKIANLMSVQNRELIYPALSKGYVDAIAAHETSILQYMKDYDIQYRILKEPLQEVGIGVAFEKGTHEKLAKELNQTFKEMRKDGSAEKIIGKYLDHPKKYLEVDRYGK